jgi:maleamate amidohydrolase
MSLSDLRRDFQAAGLNGSLPYGRKPALLLVDPAQAYADPESPLYAAIEAPVHMMKELLGSARAAGIPIYITRVLHEFPTDGGLFAAKVPATQCFRPDSPWSQPIKGLEHMYGETLITKHYPSAFFGTALAASLTAQGVDTVVIAGLTTSGCVRATALDALQHGFVPVVVADATGDRHVELHDSNLRDIAAKIGEVSSLPHVQSYLRSLTQ